MYEKKTYFPYKIILGYIILILLISGISIILLRERIRIKGIEAESEQINLVRQELYTIHRQITELSILGESVISWDSTDCCNYHRNRLRIDSLLRSMQFMLDEYVHPKLIDTLCNLMGNKENHLIHIMHNSNQIEKRENLFIKQFPEISRRATRILSTKQKKNGIAGFFGWKKEIQIMPYSEELYTFSDSLIVTLQRQRQEFNLYVDSLYIRNRKFNLALNNLLGDIDKQANLSFSRKEQQIDKIRNESFGLLVICLSIVVVLLIMSYFTIHREIKRNVQSKIKQEGLIGKLQETIWQNEELIKSRQNIMQTVTHDLRSPLTAIRGNAELILKDGNREATVLHAEHIRQSAERMGALMENLLDYYRIDNGKETVRVKPFRLAGVAETLETEFAARMEEKRLEFRVNNAADEVVMGDRNLILRIGSNLLSNALKFTERGGVTLTALYAGGKFTLAVEDTGGGIDKDKREQIFKPFERLSNAATQDGFGLGLSIVKSLAELMEGSISVENIRNTGSRFSVVLPLPQAEKAGETGRKAAAKRTRLGGCSVLSLDNDSIILGMIHDIFVQNGVHCDTCTSTGEMAEKLREGHYDLLTTDLKMQDASGYEVLELLRTSDIGNSRTIPVMVVTGSKSITKEKLAGAGFGSVLYKPFSIDELLAAAEECIGEDSTPRIDLGPLFAYGDKRQRLECLVRETEKEMAAIQEEAERCDRDRLDYWIHHIRSSWMLIHAEGPLQELYDVLHGNGTAEEIREYAGKVTGQGETIIRLARKEMERTVWEE